MLTTRCKRRHLDDLPSHSRLPSVFFEFSKGQFVRHSRCAPRSQDPLTPVRRERRPTPQVLAGFGRREPDHAFRYLQVDEDDLEPRALTRPREQIRPTAQADERTREEVLRVQTCETVHEILPYLVDGGDDSRRLPRLQTERVQREAGRVGPAELMGEPERGGV